MTNFSPAATIASQKDFITASATGSKANESTGVALTFAHRLAQIEIKAKNANQGYVYKVQGVRIGQPVSQATTFDFGMDARNDEEQLRGDLYFGENPERYGRFDHGDGRQ